MRFSKYLANFGTELLQHGTQIDIKTRHRASTHMYSHVLTTILRSRYVAVATQPVHRLQTAQ